MTEAMPFLQKYDITFLRPPTIQARHFYFILTFCLCGAISKKSITNKK